MRRGVLFAAAVIGLGAMLALPGSAAAQTPAQDSVTGSGGGGLSSIGRFNFAIDAHSGPSGEGVTGTASLSPLQFGDFEGPVSCLAVEGPSATLNFVVGSPIYIHVFTFTVIDSPAGDQLDYGVDERAPSDCSPLTSTPEPLTYGDIAVIDAQPFPTSKAQCKNGGWRNYGTTFKNQGDCVSFVEHQARQECIFIRAYDRPAFRARYGTPLTKQHAMRRCIRERSDD